MVVLQRNPLDPIFEELCDSMRLDRAKLVLSYNGKKIYGGSLTPMQLGIGSDVVIGGCRLALLKLRMQMLNYKFSLSQMHTHC